jgi:hypothetical protein
MPNEDIREQLNASYRNIEGILIITNCRVLWKKVGDIFFIVNENKLNINAV